MNRVSGFIIIITGALVRISEYHIILDILIKSRNIAVHTAVRNRNTAAYRGTKFSAVPNTSPYRRDVYTPLRITDCDRRTHYN